MIPKITTAYESRDWETLGYADWDSYVQDRFGDKLATSDQGWTREPRPNVERGRL